MTEASNILRLLRGSLLNVPFDFAMIILAVGFGLVGFIDDVWGNREAGGFAGHFRELAGGHLTTGIIKVLVGGLTALTACTVLWSGYLDPWTVPMTAYIVLDACIVCLTANLINILDLRPGRACAVASGLMILAYASRREDWIACVDYFGPFDNHQEVGFPLLALLMVLVATVLFWRRDSKGLVMLGDSGANALGAFVGLLIGLVLHSFGGKLVALALLIAIHIYSEKRSISATIEANRVLRWIDRKLGVR